MVSRLLFLLIAICSSAQAGMFDLFSLPLNRKIVPQQQLFEKEYLQAYVSGFEDHLVKNGIWQGFDFRKRLSQEELKLIEKYGQDHMLNEFKRVLRIDYDKLYKEQCTDKKLLAQDVLLEEVEKNIDVCEANIQKLYSDDSWNSYKNEQANIFKFFQSNRGDVGLINEEIAPLTKDVKRIRALLGIQSRMGLGFSQENDHASSSWKRDPRSRDRLPFLKFGKDFFTRSSFSQFAVGHEMAHLKNAHIATACFFITNQEMYEGIRALCFYEEKQADIISATLGLGFARQFEHFTRQELKDNLKAGNILHLHDNTPQEPLAHTEGTHPTAILRHIHATHVLGLMEAEARWWRTGEAAERYGDVAYERAFQKWADKTSKA